MYGGWEKNHMFINWSIPDVIMTTISLREYFPFCWMCYIGFFVAAAIMYYQNKWSLLHSVGALKALSDRSYTVHRVVLTLVLRRTNCFSIPIFCCCPFWILPSMVYEFSSIFSISSLEFSNLSLYTLSSHLSFMPPCSFVYNKNCF